MDLLCMYPGPYTAQDGQHGTLDRVFRRLKASGWGWGLAK